MQARLTNPATPEMMQAINLLYKATHSAGIPGSTLELVHLRASQINGCGACVDSGARGAKRNGETDERLFAVAAWRETPYFTEAERAALALAEAATRLADRADAVPDEIWADASTRRDLGRRDQALQRAGTRGAGALDRHHQLLQPDQRHDPAASAAELGLTAASYGP
jgi:AhpD family alkylhydroperoxidase